MKIPHKVKIKPGVFYHVVWVDRFDDAEQVGWCDGNQRLIYLKKRMGKKEQNEVFIHEVLHAIEFEYEIQIPHKLVYDLSAPLALVMTQNPRSGLSSVLPQAISAAAARKRKKKRT